LPSQNQFHTYRELHTMPEFIVFMYNDAVDRSIANDGQAWGAYLAKLKATGRFNGGSSIGRGSWYRKGAQQSPSEPSIEGFIQIEAANATEAQAVLEGNPNYEAGGTVEIRELFKDE
jgi:hypothetical protein